MPETKKYAKDIADIILVENKSGYCLETKATLEKDGFIHVVIQRCSKSDNCDKHCGT